jgi:UDP-N-acetylglucosamine 2-epimerase (non-hydrolysing)
MEEGAVIMTGLKLERVLQGLAILERQVNGVRLPADYDVADVSQKVVRIILSYTDHVRRNVWKEA